MTTKTKQTKLEQSNFAVAKSSDGTIQITFTIPYATITKERTKVLEDLGKSVEVPGFRKGKAPLQKVAEHVKDDTIIQRTLNEIIPGVLGEAIRKENLKPAIYPRFELVKAEEDKPWEIRAVTCELPEVKLGDYKKELSGKGKAQSIWTPGKNDSKENEKKPQETSVAQKEQEVIKTLLETSTVSIPQILVDEEVNNRLSRLLERIEKLGLNLESYLTSVGKNVQTIRTDYETQARQAIALDLILTQVAQEEKVELDEKEIESALKVTEADPQSQEVDQTQQKAMITSILRRRKALDALIALL